MNIFLDKIYETSLIATAVTAGVLAICFYFLRPPQAVENRTYNLARLMLAGGYIFFALGIGLFVFFPLREISPGYADAWNLSYYFAVEFLFGVPFISLLSPAFLERRRMKKYVITYFVYIILLWGAVVFLTGKSLVIVVRVFALWFIIQALILTCIFLSTYKRLRRQLAMNYADATVNFIRWLNTSAWLIIGFGLACGFVIFFGRLLIAILLSVGSFVFLYIFISFQNYALHLRPVQFVSENPIVMTESREADDFIGEKLKDWIAEKRFCSREVTLGQLALEIGTNRTYLSSYINRTYSKSFSQWINDMRLENAALLLKTNETMNVSQVIEICGFSSLSYFGSLFKKAYGITPVQYRERKEWDADEEGRRGSKINK